MTAQTFLPFSEWKRVTPTEIAWLWLANASPADFGYNDWKQWRFFPFKDRFLKRFAVPDGSDLQVLKLECRSCTKGIWHSESGRFSDICDRCDGTGVYRIDLVILSRWILGDAVFHKPGERVRGVDEDVLEKWKVAFGYRVIEGVIKHPPVHRSIGRRAFRKLLLRYEPETLLRWLWSDFKGWLRDKANRVLRPIYWEIQRWDEWLYRSDSRLAADLREFLNLKDEDVPF